MIKKQWLLTIIFSLAAVVVSAQVEEQIGPENQREAMPERLIDRLEFSADVGLSFGSITYIKLAPVVGYKITSRFTAGLGPIYIYEKYKDFHLESSTYGGKAVFSYTILRSSDNGGVFRFGNVLLHVENELVSVETYTFDSFMQPYFRGRVWIDNLLLGAGLNQPIGGRMSISMYLLWDVTQNKYSPYTNPIFKFGFNF